MVYSLSSKGTFPSLLLCISCEAVFMKQEMFIYSKLVHKIEVNDTHFSAIIKTMKK